MDTRIVRVAAAAVAGVSALALSFTSANEGTKYRAYRDVGNVWTICTGHTGPEVREGVVATSAQCDAYLRADMETANVAIRACVKAKLTVYQVAALQDFAFNVGYGNFCHSTLVAKLNKGDERGAAAQFSAWTKAGGKTSTGLAARREREAALFLKDIA
jgi:lysozyme